jgi:hypothetical protein
VELDRGFCKCQKSREDQQARTGRNKTDRPKADHGPREAAVIADLAPVVVIVEATVADARAVVIAATGEVTAATAAAASMAPRKSISTN